MNQKIFITRWWLVLLLAIATGPVRAQQELSQGYLRAVYQADSLGTGSYRDSISCSFNGSYWETTYKLNDNRTTLLGSLSNQQVTLLFTVGTVKIAFRAPSIAFLEQQLIESKENKTGELDYLNRTMGEFKATGRRQTINGLQAEQYRAALPNNESLMIWTTTELTLPGSIANYPMGSISRLLKGKKIKGTLLSAVYGKKLDVKLSIEPTTTLPPISLDIPQGYELYNIEDIMGNKKEAGGQ